MVSQETRLSLPSRCSTTTRIVSAMKTTHSLVIPSGQSPPRNLLSACGTATAERRSACPGQRPGSTQALQNPQFVAHLVYQLLRHFRWRTFDDFRLLRFLRNVQPLDL